MKTLKISVTGNLEGAEVDDHESRVASDRREHSVVLEPVDVRCGLSVDHTQQRRVAT